MNDCITVLLSKLPLFPFLLFLFLQPWNLCMAAVFSPKPGTPTLGTGTG